MIITNKYNLPEPYYKSCLRDNHPRFGWNTFSVTELNKGVKEIILNRRHWNELEQDCSDMAWTVFGTAVHKVMEGHDGENELAEERVSMTVSTPFGPKNVSGGFDLYNAETKVLTDYKTTGVFSYQMKLKEGTESEWAKQLRIYWLILGKSGFPVKAVRNVIFLKDWSKTSAKRDSSYPQTPVVTINYGFSEVFNSEAAAYLEADLAEKITEVLKYKDLPEDQIPDCTEEERWERGECWAVMKKGRKSAIKRHDRESDAQRHLESLDKNHYIEHRPGIPVKCVDYCVCANKCSFYKNYMASLNEDMEGEAVNG
jgi:hypothetical protein